MNSRPAHNRFCGEFIVCTKQFLFLFSLKFSLFGSSFFTSAFSFLLRLSFVFCAVLCECVTVLFAVHKYLHSKPWFFSITVTFLTLLFSLSLSLSLLSLPLFLIFFILCLFFLFSFLYSFFFFSSLFSFFASRMARAFLLW